MNTIKTNILFGVSIYYVQTYKKTIGVAKEVKIDLPNNIFLGVKCDTLYFLTPTKKEIIQNG